MTLTNDLYEGTTSSMTYRDERKRKDCERVAACRHDRLYGPSAAVSQSLVSDRASRELDLSCCECLRLLYTALRKTHKGSSSTVKCALSILHIRLSTELDLAATGSSSCRENDQGLRHLILSSHLRKPVHHEETAGLVLTFNRFWDFLERAKCQDPRSRTL